MHISTSIDLYQEGNLEGLNLEDLGQYLKEKTLIPFHLYGNIYKGLSEERVDTLAKEYVRIKVNPDPALKRGALGAHRIYSIHPRDKSRGFPRGGVKDPEKRFTPLERTVIYGGDDDDIDRISIPHRKGEVKIPSFLTGLTPRVPLQAEIDYEKRRIRDSNWRIFGILYEGVWYQKIVSELIDKGVLDFNRCCILFTNQLFGTWDRDDRRYHARVSIYGFPHLISTTGLVEAPAKPKEFYIKKHMGVPIELLKEEYQGRFLDHGDLRITEVLKGYVMQALFFHLLGEPFCEDRDCRLFNSHWQEEVLHAQMDGQYEFCPKHEAILKKLKKKVANNKKEE